MKVFFFFYFFIIVLSWILRPRKKCWRKPSSLVCFFLLYWLSENSFKFSFQFVIPSKYACSFFVCFLLSPYTGLAALMAVVSFPEKYFIYVLDFKTFLLLCFIFLKLNFIKSFIDPHFTLVSSYLFGFKYCLFCCVLLW